jgi:tRNA threonylcarbamoyl adenosine modification protein (Sua5/YciO/YrdC/YwlC family)
MADKLPAINDPKVVTWLNDGSIGVLPTDTIYGVTCTAANPQAVQRLYSLKKRDKKPGTVIAASIDQLVDLGLKRRYLKAVEEYWPGPVTIIIPTDNPTLSYLDQGVGSLAVRVVDDPKLVKVLEQTGALLTSSANHPGQDPADTILEAEKYFGDHIDFYVDGGDLSGRAPSTIIRIVDDAIEVLRQGAVEIKENE